MKRLLTTILAIIFMSNVYAGSGESEFIAAHIASFSDLHVACQNFERALLSTKSKDTALKYIDEYSLSIEKALSGYEGYKLAKNELIREVSTDISKMLADIMQNNYHLLGDLVKTDFENNSLHTECEKLVKKNRYISNFLKDVTIGVCMTTVKKPAKGDEQFSRLTENERNDINKQLIAIYGRDLSNRKKEETATAFEYSCTAIYEFVNMVWVFEKE